MADQNSLIEALNLSKKYSDGENDIVALDSVSFCVNENDFVSITGPSGCGKSTLLTILAGLDSPTSGKLFFKTKAIHELSFSQKCKFRNDNIGFIFQSFNLIGDLTVIENVILPLKFNSNFKKNEYQLKAAQCLSEVGMSDKLNAMPSQLSGGQQQRVAIARALVCNPSVILADEPTGNLDSKNSQQIMSLFNKLHENGATIVMVTHSEQFAQVAKKQIRLNDGRLVLNHD